ncbi:MAG: gluconolactonase [Verrucomicrobia bacterium]|nr:gluconolactonase [Verrucomicrobiota bacterium]
MGRLEKFTHANSAVFPGTVRDGWIYVPVQYDPATPACVMIVQDGADHLKHERRWHIPTVLDNLIHRREIPVTIGIFINPGIIPSSVSGAAPRPNRSFEYDSLGDRYARFLLEEILPEASRRYNLRQDGNSRCVMGGSSGAFCAFNAAWERPNDFRRVLSIVGSYAALRGGNAIPALVRLTEPKPLRVFLQSGAADLKVFAGDWWTANLEMLSALEYAGYEVDHAWAEHAGHDEFHGSMIFPDALRWVWKNYPNEIAAGKNSRQAVMRVLRAGDEWEPVPGAYVSAGAMASDSAGRIYFSSPAENTICVIAPDGAVSVCQRNVGAVGGIACGGSGEIFASDPAARRIVRFDASGARSVVHEQIDARGLCVATNGSIYALDAATRRIWLLRQNGKRIAFDTKLLAPTGVKLSADETQLLVSDARGKFSWIFTLASDGSLSNGAPFFRLTVRDHEDDAGAGEIALSDLGWGFIGTYAGLQLADMSGLVAGIVPRPHGQVPSGVAIGGAANGTLFATAGNRVYRRRINRATSIWC